MRASLFCAFGCQSASRRRAVTLENFLAGLPADDERRTRYAPLLACLKAGQEPPADLIAELERK